MSTLGDWLIARAEEEEFINSQELEEKDNNGHSIFFKVKDYFKKVFKKEIKEDTKEKYIPFSSREEFFKGYCNYLYNPRVPISPRDYFLMGYWLKEISTGEYKRVSGIWVLGLSLSGKLVLYDEMLEKYCFLDGSPCGKLQDGK